MDLMGRPRPSCRCDRRRSNQSRPGGGGGGGGTSWTDQALQTTNSGTAQYSLGTSFDGASESGYIPSDSNLDVGICAAADCGGTATEQIVEVTNVNYAVYSASGTALLGPVAMHTIWSGFTSSMCSTVDGGDPIALFDRIDQRWVISQLAYNNSLNNDHLCLAISTTSDAIGSYTLYDINFGFEISGLSQACRVVRRRQLRRHLSLRQHFSERKQLRGRNGLRHSPELGHQSSDHAEPFLLRPQQPVVQSVACRPGRITDPSTFFDCAAKHAGIVRSVRQ